MRSLRTIRSSLSARLAMLLCAGLLVTAGCSSSAGTEQDSQQQPSETSPAPEPVALNLEPAKGDTGYEPGEPVTVHAEHGKLTEVKLVGKDGTVVKGELGPKGTSWTSTQELGYGKTYKLTATGVGAGDKRRTETSTFTTADPRGTVGVRVNFADGQTVGVGMPLIFTFTRAVPDRAAAEKALQISSDPNTVGAFHWFSDQRVIWRPKEHWQSGTTVTVHAEIYGQDLGNGIFGSQDKSFELTVGDKVVAVADGQTHTMTVQVNGATVKTYEISMGDAAHPTPKGTYTVMADHTDYVMDSSTYGLPVDAPGGYKLTVDYATRLSWSGIFFHSASWSVWAQGERNVSHGCINMKPSEARWLMEHSKPGDLFKVVNSGGTPLRPTDGWSVWQMSWEQWKTSDS